MRNADGSDSPDTLAAEDRAKAAKHARDCLEHITNAIKNMDETRDMETRNGFAERIRNLAAAVRDLDVVSGGPLP